MPSAVSVILREEIRLIKPILNKFSIATARLFQDKLGEIGVKSVADKIEIAPVPMDGFEACFVTPVEANEADGRVILYLHGGGYVAGNLQYASGFASILAAETNLRVLSAAYRLAPENPFPAAVDDACAAYQHLLDQGFRPQDISLVGESAGGGLVFSLCLMLKQKGIPLPGAVVGISPWTDLTFSGGSYITNEKKDPSLTEKTLRGYAEAYAKGQENNALVSPVLGDLSGFPPSLIFVGSEELLLDDAVMLAEKLRNSGSSCELIIEEGLWHVYVLFKIPEANEALNKIVAFLGYEYERQVSAKSTKVDAAG